MFSFPHAIASLFLVTAPALVAGTGQLQLSYDAGQHIAHIGANVDAEVLVLVGTRANPVIHVNGIDILVQPTVFLPLGTLQAGDRMDLPVPGETDGVGFQLVGIELDKFALVASEAVFFDLRDLIDRSFRASLVLTPDSNQLNVNLTAPTSGYALRLDGVDLGESSTRVWLRLEVPNPSEIVMPVLTEVNLTVKLPLVIGRTVEVNMARDVRGSVVLPVYKLMTVLDGHPNKSE